MALTAFDCIPKDSFVHRLDVRTKIACMVMIGIAGSRAMLLDLAVWSMIVGAALVASRAPLGFTLKQLRIFFLFLVFVFLARTLSMDFRNTVPAAGPLSCLSTSRQAMVDGALVCWRLLLVAITGFTFISTCSFAQIKAGLQWYLAPLPLVPEKRIATMVGLILRFIPRIIYQADETMQAQKARCIDNRKNPIYRLKAFVFSLARGIFRDADRLAIAMAARGYHEERTDPQLSAAPADRFVLIAVVAVFSFTFF